MKPLGDTRFRPCDRAWRVRRPASIRIRTAVFKLLATLVFPITLTQSLAYADSAPKPGITPIQAELLSDLQARLLKVGGSVYARVTVDWKGTDCALRDGAILEARVVSVTPAKGNPRGSEVDLAFDRAQCDAMKMGNYGLMLAALAAPPRNSDLGIMTAPLPLNTAGSGGLATLKVMQMGSNFNFQIDQQKYQFPMRGDMKMGDVSGIRGLKLDVGGGPENSTVLTSKTHDVALEKHTLLLLVPTRGTFPGTAKSSAAPQPPSPGPPTLAAAEARAAVPPAPPPDDLEECAPPRCNVALPLENTTDPGRAEASISVNELGYSPRPQKLLQSLEHDEALAYLAPTQLLVAFNPHTLATRHSLGRAGWTVRIIRAALVDTATRRVTRTVDWELPDDRDYLWPLPENRVLVHVGSELRVYGAGLKILNRIPLDGPLAFVRVTPDGDFIAVGVTRERHTNELHAQLRESLAHDPDEDVEVVVFNRNLDPIARSSVQSSVVPPTLLDAGQARILAQPNMRYRLAMLTWDNKSTTLAHFNSSCTPEMTSMASDLIFLVSCDKQTKVRQYRVLNASGSLALKGGSNPTDCDLAAKGSPNRDAFVVKTVQTIQPVAPGDAFSAADFSSEELSVFGAADGKRLLSVRVPSPSPSRDGFALSSDSSQLAVLTRGQVSLYSIPHK